MSQKIFGIDLVAIQKKRSYINTKQTTISCHVHIRLA